MGGERKRRNEKLNGCEDTWVRQDRRGDKRGADEPSEARTVTRVGSRELMHTGGGCWCLEDRESREPAAVRAGPAGAELTRADDGRTGEQSARSAARSPGKTPPLFFSPQRCGPRAATNTSCSSFVLCYFIFLNANFWSPCLQS